MVQQKTADAQFTNQENRRSGGRIQNGHFKNSAIILMIVHDDAAGCSSLLRLYDFNIIYDDGVQPIIRH